MTERSVDRTGRWFKTDLQIASPTGGFAIPGADLISEQGKIDAAKRYVETLRTKGIEVFAVTSHNSMTMMEEIRVAAREASMTLFPGMELSTGSGSDGVHLLLIGDPDADLADLEYRWNTAAGFDVDHPPFEGEHHLPSPRTILDILSDLPEETIAIAPHVFSENGIASGDSIKESSLRWRGLHHDRLNALDVGASNGSNGFNKHFRERTLDHFPVVSRIAYVATSDAYSEQDLTRSTWIRMHEPNLECLRQALLDHGARVIRSDDPAAITKDPNSVSHAWINDVSLRGLTTSDDDIDLEFHPRINVIIGSRGSGKSTIVQALRTLYGQREKLPGPIEAESELFRSQVFGEANLSSGFAEPLSGRRGVVSWNPEHGSRVADDTSLPPVRVVSQKELFERTSGVGSSESSNLLSLVDEAFDDDQVALDLSNQDIEVSSFRTLQFRRESDTRSAAYSDAARRYQESRDTILDKPRVTGALAEAERKLEALDDEDAREGAQEAERRIADGESLTKYLAAIESYFDEVEAVNAPRKPDVPTAAISEQVSVLEAAQLLFKEEVERARNKALQQIEQVRTELALPESPVTIILEDAAKVKKHYSDHLEQVGVNLDQYEAIKLERAGLETEASNILRVEANLPSVRQLTDDAWVALQQLFDSRRHARQALLSDVESRVSTLRFDLVPNADALGWARSVREVLNLRSGDHLEALPALADWLWGKELEQEDKEDRGARWRDALLRSNVAELGVPAMTPSLRKRIEGASISTRLELAKLLADDLLLMEFLRPGRKREDESSWQSVAHGSPGQRSAAMLAFTLSFGDGPLVLDQPEDDLDSALVSELIVTQLRKIRWHRQVIVVTHEANIPVNVDAERIIELGVEGNTIAVRESKGVAHVGSIDAPLVRRSIQTLLEGGVDAFVNRERRYDNELSNYRRDRAMMRN